MKLADLWGKKQDINAGVKEYQATDNALLIDVRTAEEYRQGHIEGSVNMPLDTLAHSAMEKAQPLFVYCLSGARSKQACHQLQKQGYTVTNIGGIREYRGTLV